MICQRPYTGRTASEKTFYWIVVLDHVTDIELKFHDGKQWRTQWGNRLSEGLPRAVKIGLTVADGQGRPYHVETIVPVGSIREAPMEATPKRSAGGLS